MFSETDEEESGRFLEYALERPDVQPVWKEFTEHAFVASIANGTLPVEKFKTYLIQDYLYLVSGRGLGI
jgi:thiaminase